MTSLINNIVWHALNGAHAKYSLGNDQARRYMQGFAPLVGFANLTDPDFEALSRICQSNEKFYVTQWTGPVAHGWQILAESSAYQMFGINEQHVPDEDPEPTLLGSEHLAQILELVSLTHTEPFGPRTIELGEYFGFFRDQKLVSMCGERIEADTFREVCSACTHPDYRSQGLARRLIQKIMRRQYHRGQTPFGHVMKENTHALDIYKRMGFESHKEVVVRVIKKL